MFAGTSTRTGRIFSHLPNDRTLPGKYFFFFVFFVSVFIPSLSHIVEPTRQVLLRTRYDEANPDKVFLIVRNNEKNHIKWNETWNSSLGLFAWWTRGFTRLRFPSMRAGALTFQRCKKQQMRQIYLCYFFRLVLIFGPFWVIFGPFWQFWVIFGPIWTILGQFWAILGHFWPFFVLFFLAKYASVLFKSLFATLLQTCAIYHTF